MARAELKKPMADLWDKHRKLENELIPHTDKESKLAEEIAKLRRDEFSNKEALDTLSRATANNAARSVLKASIDEIRIQIREKSTEYDKVLKQKSLVVQQLKNLKSSIKELDQG